MSTIFDYEFMRNAFYACTIVGIVSGAVGYFLVLRGQTFAGHALSHVGQVVHNFLDEYAGCRRRPVIRHRHEPDFYVGALFQPGDFREREEVADRIDRCGPG